MGFEEDFKKFQSQFEETVLSLISNMSKINETLDRVQSAMDLTDKIRIQNVENKQILSQLEKQVKALLRRLDKMSRGGFEIPEEPTETAKSPADDLDALLNATIEVPATTDEINENVPETPQVEQESAQPINKSIPQAAAADESSTVEEISTNEIGISSGTGAMEGSSVGEKENSSNLGTTGSQPSDTDISEMTIPEPASSQPAQTIESEQIKTDQAVNEVSESEPVSPVESVYSEPVAPIIEEKKEVPVENDGGSIAAEPSIQNTGQAVNVGESAAAPQSVEDSVSEAGNPLFSVSGWSKVANPTTPREILTNLMVDIENAQTLSDVGLLITKAKDALNQRIPFSKVFFDMLMVAGKYQFKKGVPNSKDVVEFCFNKIKDWMNQF